MAATGAEPGCRLRVDCLPCVTAFKAGKEWAASDRRVHARVNKLMTGAWGDFDVDQMSWMPSHTTAQDVGVRELGNGEKLTELDRRGNALADKLAKAGADTHRVPEAIRNKIAAQDALIEGTGRWVGRATYIANNQEAESHRDTTATTKATRASKLARAKAAEVRRRSRVKCAAKTAKRPQALRGHSLIKWELEMGMRSMQSFLDEMVPNRPQTL